jgi:hypothetical protein
LTPKFQQARRGRFQQRRVWVFYVFCVKESQIGGGPVEIFEGIKGEKCRDESSKDD